MGTLLLDDLVVGTAFTDVAGANTPPTLTRIPDLDLGMDEMNGLDLCERILGIRGIVNGTSNYILSRMTEEGLSFEVALAEAQAAGYAEADPTLDVGGGDACHKIAILATLAFGQRVPADQIPTEGIDTVSPLDIAFARRLGFIIKPLAVARVVEDAVDLRVHPALVPVEATLATLANSVMSDVQQTKRVKYEQLITELVHERDVDLVDLRYSSPDAQP